MDHFDGRLPSLERLLKEKRVKGLENGPCGIHRGVFAIGSLDKTSPNVGFRHGDGAIALPNRSRDCATCPSHQSQRTGFEARVLEEARRLMDGHYCELARDALERPVVDRLLMHRDDGRSDLAVQGAGALCPVTHLRVHNSTFLLQPACG